MLELNAKVRKILGKKVKTLRKKGIIPAVVYGAKIESIPLEIDYNEFEKAYEETGESTIIKLKIKGLKAVPEERNVLIQEIAKDPVYDKFNHIDFQQVRMDKLITAEVHLIFEGKSPVVEIEGGTLIKDITEIEVEALPANLPHEIKIDISVLKTFDDSIKVKDLKISEDVKILAEPEKTIASVLPPRTKEELEESEEKTEGAEEAGTGEEGSTPTQDESGTSTSPSQESKNADKK